MSPKLPYLLGVLTTFIFTSFTSQAQTINKGKVVIRPETTLITLSEFVNQKPGVIINDGNLYITNNYHNDGLVLFTEKLKKGYTVFGNKNQNTQTLSGTIKSEFYDVLFDNNTSQTAFHLDNDFQIFGTANFKEGVVKIDSELGGLIFNPLAKAINASDNSHVDGEVEKLGKNTFTFPIGKQGYYRPASIIDPTNTKSHITAAYFFENPDKNHPISKKADIIETLNEAEYWQIHRENPAGEIILALSWNEKTTPPSLLKDPEQTLHIVRWDTDENKWIDEGGIVDVNTKTVRTPVKINQFGTFTLATIKKEIVVDTDVIIYNAVSPNGDGHNDFFRIENINRYPNNHVQIFNRWGALVFETRNYDSNGNVFTGISEGKGTIQRNEKLPTGTYYYVVKYEYTDGKGSEMITRSGYLHLENQ